VSGTTAVLVGAGGLGQYGLQFLKLLSPATVVIVDSSADKRRLALELGADQVVDPADADAMEQIKVPATARAQRSHWTSSGPTLR
jgi:propanol-preferring alcohol dehydrogenase